MRRRILAVFSFAAVLVFSAGAFGSSFATEAENPPEVSEWRYVGAEYKTVEYQKGGNKKLFTYLTIEHYENDEFGGVVWEFNNGERAAEIGRGWWPKERPSERLYAFKRNKGWTLGMVGEEPFISEPLLFEDFQTGDQFKAIIRISLRLPPKDSWERYLIIRRIITFP